jgi:hypothetical protein
MEGGQCLRQPIRPGDPCHPNLTPCISISNSTCVEKMTSPSYWWCECNRNFWAGGKECYPDPTLPGHMCDPVLAPCPTSATSTTCEPSDSDLNLFYCTCGAGYITSWSTHQCVKTSGALPSSSHASAYAHVIILIFISNLNF